MPGLVGPGHQDDAFTLEDLLQELFMALMGYTGDVFVDSSPADDHRGELLQPDACSISLASDILLASSVSRDQLNQLVRLGFHFKQLQRFIQHEQHPLDGRVSMYRRALCNGLEEVCAVYEDEVVMLQEQLLQHGADQGLPGIMYQLADLQRLMQHMHQLAYELRRRNPLTLSDEQLTAISRCRLSSSNSSSSNAAEAAATAAAAAGGGSGSIDTPLVLVAPATCGARLLHWLHDRRLNGEPLLQAAIQRLLWHVNQVLFNQLTMWMVHGLLVDSGAEFFIQPRGEDATVPGQPPAAGAAATADDTQAQRDSGSAGGLDGGPVTAEDTYRDFHAAFAVALTELPPCISPHTATSIEFVGRAVRLMRSPPASAKLSAMQGSAASAAQHQQQQQQHQGSAAGLAGAPPQQLLPHGDAMAYAAALRVLQEQPLLSEAALERTVEAIRADVASRLWQLLVVQSGLMEHLVAIKDYMLLAKGDFYQCFLTDAAKLLGGAKASASTNRELAVAWQSAASKTSAAEDPHLKLFSIVYDGDAEARRQAAAAASASEAAEMYDMWDDLKIQARLPWPLGVLVTGEHLARYNAVFQLLLRLKRVQLLLESAWQDIGRLFKFKKPDKDGQQQRQQQQWHRQQAGPELRQLLQLRQHMGHLVANLQVYLQLDVVEANFDILVQRVAAAQDFGEVEYAHGRFLAAITSQSLLSMRSVMNPLVAAFVEARQLAHLVRNHVAKHAGDTDPLQARFNAVDVKAIKAAFDAKATMFYTSLRARALRVHDVAPYLGQLYQRLDFNAYLDGSMPWVKASSQRLQQPSPYKADRLRVQAAQQQERQQAQEKQAQQGQREQQQRRGLAATGLAAAGLG